jgi:deoxyribodipyrimidine photo-lyase
MRPLVWIRSDLRVRDNPALHAAAIQAERGVLAVFFVCPDQWAEHDWGSLRVDFVLRNVAALSQQLAGLNIPLRVETVPRFDDVPERLDALAAAHACTSLYFNREYEVNEKRRDQAVAARFLESGRQVHTFNGQLIFSPETVRKNDGGFYSVYSPYKRRWIELFKETDAFKVLGRPKKQPERWLEPSPVPEALDEFDGRTRPDLWTAGEDHAQNRLAAFIDGRIADYKQKRDFPAVNGTSTLSPYLASGVISAGQCLQAALDANQNRVDSGQRGVVAWISELIWREFYKAVLVGWPRVSMHRPFQEQTDEITWNDNQELFERWCDGQTGVPIVDAAMRQLNQTGWMHNRLRMIVAMYLTKDLFIDWRWGERYFMQQLVDGDLASNNGGWQWSASTGTDAQPYFRIFNPYTQGERFDPEGTFVRKFVPELADVPTRYLHAPHEHAHKFDATPDYPRPAVDHKQARAHALEVFKALKKN